MAKRTEISVLVLVFFVLDPTDRMLAVVINAAKKKKKKEKVLGPRRKKKENLE